jgi:cobalt-zinc-cadmium efflux system outer membrane protein
MLPSTLLVSWPAILFSVAAVSDPAAVIDEAVVATGVWSHAPEVLAARREILEADAIAARSRLLPNPNLQAAWGGLPLGERNPADLRFSQVPNYTLGVSQLFEIGKRGPRQQAADAGRRLARLHLDYVYRQNFFAVMTALADQAAAVARIALLEQLIAGSAESLRLQRARANRGDVAPLEVDRLEVEHLRLSSSLQDAVSTRDGARATCAQVFGTGCPVFTDPAGARAWLDQRAAVLPAAGDAGDRALESRPDIAALVSFETQQRAEERLAARQVIPDPSVSLAYTRDQLVVAGNQANTLTLGMSLPLPVFDRGQPEAARARELVASAVEQRRTLIDASREALARGREQHAALRSRARTLDEQALPLARGVVQRIEGAARRGGAALPEVLLARRALEDLELDRLDVVVTLHRLALGLRATAGIGPAIPDTKPSRGDSP